MKKDVKLLLKEVKKGAGELRADALGKYAKLIYYALLLVLIIILIFIAFHIQSIKETASISTIFWWGAGLMATVGLVIYFIKRFGKETKTIRSFLVFWCSYNRTAQKDRLLSKRVEYERKINEAHEVALGVKTIQMIIMNFFLQIDVGFKEAKEKYGQADSFNVNYDMLLECFAWQTKGIELLIAEKYPEVDQDMIKATLKTYFKTLKRSLANVVKYDKNEKDEIENLINSLFNNVRELIKATYKRRIEIAGSLLNTEF